MVDGIAQMNKLLTKTIPDRVRAAAVIAMEKGAEEIVQMMRSLAPISADGSHGKAPGTLRNSIGWTWGDAPEGSFTIGTVQGRDYNTLRITIYAGSNDAFYARWLEFGTVKTRQYPFFYSSYRSKKTRVRSRIRREISKAIKASSA